MSVRVTTFQSLDEAFTKLSTGRFQFDVIFTAPDHLPRLVGRRLVQPLNLDLIPNLRDGGLAGAAEPVLRRRPALLGAVHALHDRDRLAQRQARATSTRTSSAGSRSGSPRPSAAASACSTTRARGSGMALMHRGVTDLNTEDPALLAARRGRPQGAQRDRAREGDDQRLRDAARRAHVAQPGVVGRHAQRGHLLPARGHQRRRPLLLVPEGRRAGVQRLHVHRASTRPSRCWRTAS